MPRYYPNSHPHQLNEDLRILYDHVYQLQDQLAAERSGKGVVTTGGGGTVGGKKATADPPKKETATPNPGGPSTTKIAGLYVKGTPPQHGVSTFYDSKSGQLEFKTVASAVAPPTAHNSPGIPGQVAFQRTGTNTGYLYTCVADNEWTRVTISDF